jgi:hypothetical protein
MSTRAQERCMGERNDLWDVIVNNDDICFKHILPKLNQTDIKFLYDVNTETRALIKRSSRRLELKKAFRIDEMLSISTLEFAWNNVQWGTMIHSGLVLLDQAHFCNGVTTMGKLELLKWVREEKNCEWDFRAAGVSAMIGNLEMLKYCVANECPVEADACSSAASEGQLECLKYLHEEVQAPWDSETASQAAKNGHLYILEYLVERKYDEFDVLACWNAASKGHLDCLKFLHKTAKAPWNFQAVRYALENNHSECLQYLLDNDCPLPEGWQYSDGTLFGESTINVAAKQGNLEMIQYCLAKNCPMNGKVACARAASGGSLECLKYLHEEVQAPWNYETASQAAENGHLHILEYLVERKYDEFNGLACKFAAKNGHLNCLKYLHETAKAPWDSDAVRYALENNHSECSQYLLDNNCPLPEEWRYEDGELY